MVVVASVMDTTRPKTILIGLASRAPVWIRGAVARSHSASTMDHPRTLPHGPLRLVGDGVYVVTGEMHIAPLVRIPRNMVVIADEGELTLVNAVRLSDAGEAELARLGTVRHLVKLGAFHDRDDPYYVERFAPRFWAVPGASHREPLTADGDLMEDAPRLPIPRMRVVRFSVRFSGVALSTRRCT